MRITLWTDKEVNENELAVLKALHARGFAVCVFTPDEMCNVLQEEVEDAMAEAGWREIDFHAGEWEEINITLNDGIDSINE